MKRRVRPLLGKLLFHVMGRARVNPSVTSIPMKHFTSGQSWSRWSSAEGLGEKSFRYCEHSITKRLLTILARFKRPKFYPLI